MYLLSNIEYIAKGLHRECYVHPENADLCIKVVVNGNDAETEREQKYYDLLKRKKITWDMLPCFYGNVETDLGQGAVFDLVRDSNGVVANTLTHYLRDPIKTEINYVGLLNAFADLKAYLLEENIITMTLKPKNIVYQKVADNKGRLVIIDNIGNSDFIPVASYFKSLGRVKMQRRWKNFEMSLIKDYPENSCIFKIISEINSRK